MTKIGLRKIGLWQRIKISGVPRGVEEDRRNDFSTVRKKDSIYRHTR